RSRTAAAGSASPRDRRTSRRIARHRNHRAGEGTPSCPPARDRTSARVMLARHHGMMRLHFLGAARTVTGSQYLLETDRARVLIDCGMFQGSPHEVLRNRVPLAYDPHAIDAILLTHAHLDHCGLIPHVTALGLRGQVFATRG